MVLHELVTINAVLLSGSNVHQLLKRKSYFFSIIASLIVTTQLLYATASSVCITHRVCAVGFFSRLFAHDQTDRSTAKINVSPHRSCQCDL